MQKTCGRRTVRCEWEEQAIVVRGKVVAFNAMQITSWPRCISNLDDVSYT